MKYVVTKDEVSWYSKIIDEAEAKIYKVQNKVSLQSLIVFMYQKTSDDIISVNLITKETKREADLNQLKTNNRGNQKTVPA